MILSGHYTLPLLANQAWEAIREIRFLLLKQKTQYFQWLNRKGVGMLKK